MRWTDSNFYAYCEFVQEVLRNSWKERKGGLVHAIFWGRETSRRVTTPRPQNDFLISAEQVSGHGRQLVTAMNDERAFSVKVAYDCVRMRWNGLIAWIKATYI